ncbi:hypothetical protein ACFQ1E_10835 [Sphingomonas canadensis]|uniref:Uncharacterized protein n=1 Tax=Sphingomonas canadensis TaxID=1219257 RepID=A0ABW3H6A6_9SPHN|nr:hypothetical protein [Sphingomonas canadensis]MCW3836385.1 hypothetical protein [Sphingomonas canadensis]
MKRKTALTASALAALLAVPAAAPASPGGWGVTTQQMVIHVPRMTVTRTTIVTRSFPRRPPPMVFTERKADDCVKLDKIVGFAVSPGDTIELMLSDGKRLRARLGSNCPALGFYSGFYVRPHKDGKMCAKRDSIRSRSGGTCSIDSFRALVPAR